MGIWTTVAELLKIFAKIPPLSLLHLCNPDFGKYVTEHLLQHGDDLDFVQDILSAVGSSKELNPILNSVLAGFGRRKRQGRFKCGQLNLHFDRLRFAETATPEDNDMMAKDLTKKTPQQQRIPDHLNICKFFQKPGGCRFSSSDCRFVHRCVICNMTNHGAITCYTRTNSSGPEPARRRESQRQERPPNPRFRRGRANFAGNRD